MLGMRGSFVLEYRRPKKYLRGIGDKWETELYGHLLWLSGDDGENHEMVLLIKYCVREPKFVQNFGL